MTEQTKRVRRSKKQQYLDARSAYEKKQKTADDAKTLMQLAYAAWQSELEPFVNVVGNRFDSNTLTPPLATLVSAFIKNTPDPESLEIFAILAAIAGVAIKLIGPLTPLFDFNVVMAES